LNLQIANQFKIYSFTTLIGTGNLKFTKHGFNK